MGGWAVAACLVSPPRVGLDVLPREAMGWPPAFHLMPQAGFGCQATPAARSGLASRLAHLACLPRPPTPSGRDTVVSGVGITPHADCGLPPGPAPALSYVMLFVCQLLTFIPCYFPILSFL